LVPKVFKVPQDLQDRKEKMVVLELSGSQEEMEILEKTVLQAHQ